jgi:hypothetical protein
LRISATTVTDNFTLRKVRIKIVWMEARVAARPQLGTAMTSMETKLQKTITSAISLALRRVGMTEWIASLKLRLQLATK